MPLAFVQLVEELSQELDELRSFKAEFMSKSELPAELSQKQCKQLEAIVMHLKEVIWRFLLLDFMLPILSYVLMFQRVTPPLPQKK